MIFSLSSNLEQKNITLPSEEFDIFCYFHSEKYSSIELNSSLVISSILASLRMKRGVLIISNEVSENEEFSFNRGVRAHKGSGYIYLAPHSLSLLRTQISQIPHSYQDLMASVVHSNLLKA